MDSVRRRTPHPRLEPVIVVVQHAYDLHEAALEAHRLRAEGRSPVAVAPLQLHGRVAALEAFDGVREP